MKTVIGCTTRPYSMLTYPEAFALGYVRGILAGVSAA